MEQGKGVSGLLACLPWSVGKGEAFYSAYFPQLPFWSKWTESVVFLHIPRRLGNLIDAWEITGLLTTHLYLLILRNLENNCDKIVYVFKNSRHV